MIRMSLAEVLIGPEGVDMSLAGVLSAYRWNWELEVAIRVVLSCIRLFSCSILMFVDSIN